MSTKETRKKIMELFEKKNDNALDRKVMRLSLSLLIVEARNEQLVETGKSLFKRKEKGASYTIK